MNTLEMYIFLNHYVKFTYNTKLIFFFAANFLLVCFQVMIS